MITSHDVARLAGVSQPTVSRALRGDPRVSVATREKVVRAASTLGYVRSEAGRGLVTRASFRVGVVVADLANPFYPHLLAPLHDELGGLGYRTMVFTERPDTPIAVEQLLDGAIDGVVLATSTVGSPLPVELARRGLPFVFLNRDSGAPGDAAVVDNELGGRLVAARMVELGHRRIAGVFGPADTSTGRDRELGFRRALADAGLDLPPDLLRRGPFEFETGDTAMTDLLSADRPPTAVFCGNDVIALGALDAARRADVAVPDAVSVVGFDDIPMAAWEAFRLTTVGHDLRGMAASAARLLVDRITGGGEPRRVVLRPRLVERATLTPPN
jgi:LacI family transcriptional regulator